MKQRLVPTSGTNGEQSKTFLPTELEVALLASYDLMCRGLIQEQYIAVGETAKCIKENLLLKGDGLDFVIPKKQVTPSVVSMLKEWATPEVTEKGFTYQINGVPLRFKFLKNQYDFFRFADIKVYGAEQYKIPNHEYWNYKGEII